MTGVVLTSGSEAHQNSAGGIYVHGAIPGSSGTASPVIVMNSILWGNTGGTNKEISGITNTANVKYKTNFQWAYNSSWAVTTTAGEDQTVAASISNSDIDQTIAVVAGDGNIKQDPEFEGNDFTTDDKDKTWGTQDDILRPKFASKARDAGRWQGLDEHKNTSLDKYYKKYFYDAAGRPKLGDADMGAYESYIKVLCIGDDMTRGCGADVLPWTYRASLFQQLYNNLHWNVAFVGTGITSESSTGNEVPLSYPLKPWSDDKFKSIRDNIQVQPNTALTGVTHNTLHNGYEGATTDYYTNTLTEQILNGKPASASTADIAKMPDIVLFMNGSSEASSSTVTAATMAENIGKTEKVFTDWMSAQAAGRNQRLLFIGTIPPNLIKTAEQKIVDFNAAIKKTSADGLVNINGAKHPDGKTFDTKTDPSPDFVNKENINLTQRGDEIVANGWFEALKNLFGRK